ncbi:hypothetical protein BH20CHL6_BH20CHL6_02490 [soil metagenome]
MNSEFQYWFLLLGLGLGGGLVWLLTGRLSRQEDDLDAAERAAEADWISRAITADGGIAPPELVDEVLELHRSYLAGPPLDVREGPDADRVAATEAGHESATGRDPATEAGRDVATSREVAVGQAPAAARDVATGKRRQPG